MHFFLCGRGMWKDRPYMPVTPVHQRGSNLQASVWPALTNAMRAMIYSNCTPKGELGYMLGVGFGQDVRIVLHCHSLEDQWLCSANLCLTKCATKVSFCLWNVTCPIFSQKLPVGLWKQQIWTDGVQAVLCKVPYNWRNLWFVHSSFKWQQEPHENIQFFFD